MKIDMVVPSDDRGAEGQEAKTGEANRIRSRLSNMHRAGVRGNPARHSRFQSTWGKSPGKQFYTGGGL